MTHIPDDPIANTLDDTLDDTLETQRLNLARLTTDDAEMMLTIWNDPLFRQFVGDRGIRSVEAARRALLDGAIRQYRELGYGPYRMTLKSNAAAVGICGLFKRVHLDDPDIGFSLLPGFRQHGYAYEAALAVLTHARDVLGLGCVNGIVAGGNRRSIYLLEKLGLRYEKTIRLPDEDEDLRLYRRCFDAAGDG